MPKQPILDINRKMAFSHRLKRKAEKPEVESAMTSQQMLTWDRLASEARRCVNNLHCALLEPNQEQAEMIDADLQEISSQMDALRAKVALTLRNE